MADKEFNKILAGLDKTWEKAKKRIGEVGNFAEIPDGKYFVQVVGAEIGTSQNSGRPQVHFEFAITEGEFQGQIKHSYNGLDTEDNLMYFGKDLTRMGYEAEKLTAKELPKILEDMVKRKLKLKIQLRTKNEYQNVYIQKLLDEEGGDAAPAEAAEETPAEEAEVEAEPETLEVKQGVEVKFTYKGKERTSTVLNVNEKGGLVVADGMKVRFPIDRLEVVPPAEPEPEAEEEAEVEAEAEPEPEEEAPAEDETEVALAKGMKVEFTFKKKKYQSVIQALDEKKGTVKVKADKTVVWVGADEVVVVDEGTDK